MELVGYTHQLCTWFYLYIPWVYHFVMEFPMHWSTYFSLVVVSTYIMHCLLTPPSQTCCFSISYLQGNQIIFRLWQNCERRLLASSYLSECPSSWNTSAATERISMKFDIWEFLKNLSRNSSSIETWQTTGNSH